MEYMDENRQELLGRLNEANNEIERLRSENERLKAMLEAFALKQASSLSRPPTKPASVARPGTSPALPAHQSQATIAEQRISLFRSLFRGREDVYAVRWENKKGKSGYSPACANEWNPLI